MKRVVLVTGHYLRSKRKAGFHFLAQSFHAAGWEVLFLTAPISWLSWLRRDHRFNYPIRAEANRVCQVDERLQSFVWFTPWHPANFRIALLNRLSKGLVQRYANLSLGEAEPILRAADLIVLESTPALVLFDQVRSISPDARVVYRVSDDLRRLRNHPRVIETETRIAEQFDLISVPCRFLHERFSRCDHAHLHPHGVRKELFDEPLPSPYDPHWKRNVVFVGNDGFNGDFVSRAQALFPEWAFHIIGPIRGVVKAKNIFTYGEMPFAQTVPYLKHADVGLQTVRYSPGAESLTDSLKVMQYIYCGLPVIAPDFMDSDRSNFFYYRDGDNDSIARALTEAVAFDRTRIARSAVLSWDDLRDALLEENGSAACSGSARTVSQSHAAS